MNKIEMTKNKVIHKTTGVLQGDWIIYRCALCDYELQDNIKTGELVVKNAKTEIGHKGTYKPFEIKEGTKQNYSYPTWNRN